jgi:glycosyltransferase involved in cell wall biosynthesis
MKIVYISNSNIPSRTANSIHVMKMCQAFADNGNEVILLAPRKEKNINIDDIYEYYGVKNCFEIIRYNSFSFKGSSILNALFIQKIVSKIKPDFVYGRYTPGCALSAFFKYETSFEAHSPIWESGIFDKLFFRILLNRHSFKRLVVISQALKDMYIKKGIIQQDKVLVAHDGADEQKDFNGILQDTTKMRVGYFGHLYKGRGIDIIIELSNRLTNIEFHIIGGNEDDIKYWQSKVVNTNIFFHGFVSPKDVYKYRNSCDILVAPYQKEVTISGGKGNTSAYMSPLKIFEYMSSKKAIVSSNLPVLQEVLTHNKTALLCQPTSIEEWESAIKQLNNNKKLQLQLGNNAFSEFQKMYTWKTRAQNILKNIGI